MSALWVGGDLGYLERACLRSALTAGHTVALYTHHGVSNVPGGIDPAPEECRNRRPGFICGEDMP